jgi:hypothetical protein
MQRAVLILLVLCLLVAAPPTGAVDIIISGTGTAAGLSDGDKGDVTVSGTGAVWTIDPSAVTYAKMQNTAAPAVLLGRGSASAGPPQEITLGTNLSMSGTTLNATGGPGGSSIILDLADNGVNESTALGEIATTGDTNAIFTEPAPDKLLIDLTKSWPKADAATINPANCAVAGAFPGGVDASWAAENCVTLSSVNARTATYAATSNDFDRYKTITVDSGTFTITLVNSISQPVDGKYLTIINYGSGVVTVAPNGQLINGGSSPLTLPASTPLAPSSARITSNGTNYFAQSSGPALDMSGFVTLSTPQTVSNKRIAPRALAYSATLTPTVIDCALYDTVYWSELSQDTTIDPPSGCTPSPDQRLTLTLLSTVSRLLTWSTAAGGFSDLGGKPFPTRTIAGQYLEVEVLWNVTSSKWMLTSVSQYRPSAKPLADAATIAVDANAPDGVLTLATMSQPSQFLNPVGTSTDMQYLEIRVTCTTTRAVTWDTQYSAGAGIGLPTQCDSTVGEQHWGFRRNSGLNKWVIVGVTPPAAARRNKCTFIISVGGFTLTNADMGPLLWQCPVPETASIEEIELQADAGTPSVTFHQRTGVTNTNLTSSALTTGAAGALACAKTTATTGLRGATCSAILQNTTLAGGDVTLGTTSGTASTATRVVGTIYYLRQ